MSNQLLMSEEKQSEQLPNPKLICEVEDMEVVFTDEQNKVINEKVTEFVKAMSAKYQSHSYYEEKRNAELSKAEKDQFVGKKAEVVAYRHLQQKRSFPKSGIDFEIRTGSTKGWAVDLPFAEKDANYPNVHVKACQPWMLKWAGDYSWTFQWSNNDGVGGKDKIFNGPDTDLVALVVMGDDPKDSKATIKAIMPWGEIKKHLEDPKKESLKGIKKVVNYKSLLNAQKAQTKDAA